MIGVRIASGPHFALLLVLIGFPIVGQHFAKSLGCSDLFEAGASVVLHGLWLTERHGEAISLGFVAGMCLPAVMLSASLDELLVESRAWTQWILGVVDQTVLDGKGRVCKIFKSVIDDLCARLEKQSQNQRTPLWHSLEICCTQTRKRTPTTYRLRTLRCQKNPHLLR